MGRSVYADNAATTAVVQPRCSRPCSRFYKEVYGNPSSLYSLGREAKPPWRRPAPGRGGLSGRQANEIYFTSCGSESDNWAVKGAAHAMKKREVPYHHLRF